MIVPVKPALKPFVFIVFILFFTNIFFTAFGQKQLSQSDQLKVDEAKTELNKAISDPGLNQNERMAIVERSAKTLKNYGQSPAFPIGDIPLKILIENNYNQAKKEYLDVNELRSALGGKLLNDQLKIINSMQIDVTEEQIKLLLPGKLPFDLSKDLVSTVFSWNIKEGFNNGQRGDANELKNRFLKLAETKKLSAQIELLYRDHQHTMQNLHRDLASVPALQEMLRRKYQIAEAGTHVLPGFENATEFKKNQSSGIAQAKPNGSTQKTEIENSSVEKDDFKETKYYFRLVKASTVKKVNREMYIESITNTETSMSASVKPPKPKEPFSVNASWNSPPIEFYPGETISITVKGSGDVRLDVEAFNASNSYKLERGVYNKGSYSINFNWKANAYGRFYITVSARVTAHAYAWSSTTYEYETVIIK